MSTPTTDETPLPAGQLEQKVEDFRKECEGLDQLVDDLFEQLEEVNQRLSHKSSEIEQQRGYFEQREQQWRQKQSENEDLREFFVHQNDQIAAAIEKLAAFEGMLDVDGNTSRTQELKTLLTELKAEQADMRAEQADMRQSRDDEDERRRLESIQWGEQLTRQGEQLGEALEKLSAFEGKLQTVAPTAEGEVGEQLSGLLADVQEQLTALRDRPQVEPSNGEAFDSSNLVEHLTRQDDQLAMALEKISSFEQQLSSISQAEPTDSAPQAALNELLEEIRASREELLQRTESELERRAQDHEVLQAFIAKNEEQHDESLGKLAEVEAAIGRMPTGESAAGEAVPDPRVNDLIEQLQAERDEFRERFERASEDAARLTELITGLSAISDEMTGERETKVTEALSASEMARHQLDQELVAAKSRAVELEKTVARQQEELKEERNELRKQLRELRELLELRSQWESGASEKAAEGNGNQTMVFDQKPTDDGEDRSVLAQFAKLSRK